MKSLFTKTAAAIFVTLSLYSCTSSKPESSSSANKNGQAVAHANEGDSVWVIMNYIKPDKKEQFEKFVHEAFFPKAQMLSHADKQLFQKTRILGPTRQEADGNYIYIFLIDPYVPGGDYGIDAMLKKIYGDKWQQYGNMFGETQAREQSQYMMVQTKFYRYD